MSSSLALSLRSVSKRFAATQALDGADLDIGRGEVVALMGANGAGKSTLAKIAAGVLRPDAGELAVAGRATRLSSPRDARRAGIVAVHQSTDQLGVPGLSVAENLTLDQLCGAGARVLVSPKRTLRRAEAIARLIDLDIPLGQDFAELSPAHRQLVAIARAAAAEAVVLILDEPTASLSAAEAERLFAVVDRLKRQGVGVLYISHRLGDIRRIADRLVVLRNGRNVAAQAQPFDFAATVRAMIGRSLEESAHDKRPAQTGRVVLQMTGVQLKPGAAPFNLTLRAGEVMAVTGALGAGKSRLLRGLFGVERFARGEVSLDDAPWTPNGPADSIRRGVFMAGEDRWRSSLLPAATPGGDIAGTIALPHRRAWFPGGVVQPRREREAALAVIDSLGVRCRGPEDTLDLLSGGNQQKVVVGRWQAAPSRLLLLDEPFQGVDIGARRDIAEANPRGTVGRGDPDCDERRRRGNRSGRRGRRHEPARHRRRA